MPTTYPAHQPARLRVQDEVLSRTGLFDVSYIVRKRRLGLFVHVARLRSDVPANQILRICTKTRDGDRPSQEWRRASGRPSTTWIHQICRDTGVTATEALQLAEDRPFWRTIAMRQWLDFLILWNRSTEQDFIIPLKDIGRTV